VDVVQVELHEHALDAVNQGAGRIEVAGFPESARELGCELRFGIASTDDNVALRLLRKWSQTAPPSYAERGNARRRGHAKCTGHRKVQLIGQPRIDWWWRLRRLVHWLQLDRRQGMELSLERRRRFFGGLGIRFDWLRLHRP